MPIATGLALGLGIASAAGAVGSAAIGSHAAGKAASEQSNAAMSAAQLQKQSADQALAFQKQQWDTQQKNEAPFLATGQQAAGQLKDLTSTPGQGLLSQFTDQFTAPTAEQAKQYPGYQFQLDQGTNALEKGAASRGNLLSGTEGTALQNYGQGLAQSDYTNVYNQAMQEYLNKFNIFNQNQSTEFNRLSALSGGGQTTAATLGAQGQAAAQNSGNIVQNSANQQGQDLNNAAAARASGYVGGANAWSSAIPGIENAAMIPLYSQLFKNGGGMGFDPTQPIA